MYQLISNSQMTHCKEGFAASWCKENNQIAGILEAHGASSSRSSNVSYGIYGRAQARFGPNHVGE
jgi:hypothetical protein